MNEVLPELENVKNPKYRDSFLFLAKEFLFICDKLDLSNQIQDYFSEEKVSVEGITLIEEKVRKLVNRLIDLEFEMLKIWFSEAVRSEIDTSITNWSNIISRYGYLTNWLEQQRSRIENNEEVDHKFESYETCGYSTLATY